MERRELCPYLDRLMKHAAFHDALHALICVRVRAYIAHQEAVQSSKGQIAYAAPWPYLSQKMVPRTQLTKQP